MALAWTINQKSVENVKGEISTALKNMNLPSFANVGWEGDELCVRIEKGGKSEFRLALKPQGEAVKITETKRDISFLHKPFVGKVESVVSELMGTVGAAKA